MVDVRGDVLRPPHGTTPAIERKVSIKYTTRYECRSTSDLQYSIEKVSRDRNIEKGLQTTPEDWNNKSIK